RCRQLLVDLFQCDSDTDKQALRALEVGLVTWQEACEQSGFCEEVPLVVARSAWLEAVETPSLNQRFRAGGVTFCTLMPMRAIPFEVVCLLGMNDGDYPRRTTRSDFDLMGLAGNSRPGDRSRRDDDRQLMLEALLSARQVFYISWCGHSVRDNSEQPPSVLVSQLRDYLSSGWSKEVVSSRTTQHPLQPFSRRYFEAGSPLITYAREWRAAHGAHTVEDSDGNAMEVTAAIEPMAPFVPTPNVPLTLSQLTQFLRNPVKTFFRHRLQVVFDETQEDNADDESFGVDGLQQYGLLQDLLATATAQPDEAQEQLCVDQSLTKLRKSGELPLKVFGDLEQQSLEETLSTMLLAWRSEQARFPHTANRQSVRLEEGMVVLEDWIDHLRGCEEKSELEAEDPFSSSVAWLDLQPSRLIVKVGKEYFARPEKLLGAWVRSLAIAASGAKARGILVGRDGVVEIPPYPKEKAIDTLKELLQLWLDGMNTPLPLPLKTALAFAADKDPVTTYEGGFMSSAEADDPCLFRMFPDYDALIADGRFEVLAMKIYAPLLEWVKKQVKAAVHATEDESTEVAA
ncbi:MAG TPA: exodeoxyribonuclease V subunit gamma, partial [Rhodoferax sp.]|nr:exodeoxyribonuclease V subunit gamma [Rhodoferax sp.]